MDQALFTPHHINATVNDMTGNNGIGRYVLLPGSDGRAKQIASHFDELAVKQHPRGHHLYLGTISSSGMKIDVATISSGMGCPSMEIILHELFYLGGKRFLRVGTAGSLQSGLVKLGDIVNAQASVRDEQTTSDYMPISVPAVSSFEVASIISESAVKLGFTNGFHTGTVHCKSSFYAREFGAGPSGSNNMAFDDLLTRCGVLATEMETATLFIQSQLYNYMLMQKGKGPRYRVLAGAILGVISGKGHEFAAPAQETECITKLITLAFECVKLLALADQKDS
jgi:uridine phosphorylase